MSRPSVAPRIETERLVLRGYERSDFEAFCATRAKPEVMRHISPDPMTRSQLWEKFLRNPAMWPLLGYGGWAIERREDGRLIGEVAFADFMRAPEVGLPDLPEMGWIFDSDVHGKGFAGEALGAALCWGDAHIGSAFCCIISPENAPSIRLAERQGFLAQRESEHLGKPVILFERAAGTARG